MTLTAPAVGMGLQGRRGRVWRPQGRAAAVSSRGERHAHMPSSHACCTLHPPLMEAPASLMADVTALMAGSLHTRVCKRVC